MTTSLEIACCPTSKAYQKLRIVQSKAMSRVRESASIIDRVAETITALS